MARVHDPLAVLRAVLNLERKQGYGNRAAVGGLERFSLQQIERADGRQREIVAAVAAVLSGYDSAHALDRARAVSTALSSLEAPKPVPSSEPRAIPAGRAAVAVPPSTNAANSTPDAPLAKPGPARATVPPKKSMVADLDASIDSVAEVRKPMPELLAKLGVSTVRDLLYYFPRTHYDYADTSSISRMRLGEKTTLVGTVRDVRVNRTSRSISITTATITDDSGTVAVRWFNQPYLQKQLPVGKRVAISGEPEVFNGRFVFIPRDYELIEDAELTHTARLVPIYPLTKGLYQRSLRRFVHRIVESCAPAIEDFLPSTFIERLGLLPRAEAVAQFHFPADENQRSLAKRRLAFDELLLIQIGLLLRKKDWQEYDPALAIPVNEPLREQFEASLPFQMTGAQQRVIQEVLTDLGAPRPMSRLLQGDVGSGKTIIAAAALLQIAAAGRQGVLMAPTEILAEQHFRTLSRVLAPFGVRCELLMGSTSKAQRRSLHEEMSSGKVSVFVGTHALIQESVDFADLALAITDEQHRFGVEQRAALRRKGLHPHTLAMTATPIPRTLAITIYGDLDVSAVDEMPPGRLPVTTSWLRSASDAYSLVRGEVSKGRQAFVVCPVIEETAEKDTRSVLAEHRELQELIFPELSVALLHGRMKPAEKEQTLAAFRAGEHQILVATSVVEVGIDVPNATVMVIRDAHRFGLAQLHQFRGRVGRGGEQSYCILLSAAEGEGVRERLDALTASQDGFALAEEDLRLRGPGEFWGLRQSGLPTLKVARLGDLTTIEEARTAARELLDVDPELSQSPHALLRREVRRFWKETVDLS